MLYTLDVKRRAPTAPRSVGAFLRAARRRHRIGQVELAERAGTTQAQVSRIERDLISPSLGTLDGLLRAMGETLSLGTLPLDARPPGGGNTTVRELRDDYEQLTAEERLLQALDLSELLGELAASQPVR
jgi:transcriptional regulator with XRE-family HTH domain